MNKTRTKSVPNHIGKPGTGFPNVVLWDLKLNGDINENHKGGNATTVLKHRLTLRGATLVQLENVGSIINRLEKDDKIFVVRSQSWIKAIRLNPSADIGQNPFEEHAVPATPSARTEFNLDQYRDWPLEKRLELATALIGSAYSDVAKLKGIL